MIVRHLSYKIVFWRVKSFVDDFRPTAISSDGIVVRMPVENLILLIDALKDYSVWFRPKYNEQNHSKNFLHLKA